MFSLSAPRQGEAWFLVARLLSLGHLHRSFEATEEASDLKKIERW
jgi:hypothetical protein